MKTTDTDGRLDRCYCGGYAAFRRSPLSTAHMAVCTECPEQTMWRESLDEAMIEWNKQIRSIKAKEKK